MGWFDNEKGDKPQNTGTSPQPAPARPQPSAPAQPARPAGGSTLGERVHVNGTIVCEEALRILGKVEGTIRAREDLSIAKGADVRAVIHGRRVHVEGSVKGDVHAGELVVLGPTAVLEGNIGTPSLQIQEGAFFKGSVEMRSAEAEKPAPKPAPKPAAKPATAPQAKGENAKPDASGGATGGKPGDAKAATAAGRSGDRAGN